MYTSLVLKIFAGSVLLEEDRHLLKLVYKSTIFFSNISCIILALHVCVCLLLCGRRCEINYASFKMTDLFTFIYNKNPTFTHTKIMKTL